MGCHCFPRTKWGSEYDHFIATIFRSCVYTPVQELAFWLGMANLGFWLFAQVPQIVENHVRDQVEGLSPTFIFIWLCGDITNLLGCLLTNQSQVQLITAIYFCTMDVIMLGQMGLIEGKHRLKKIIRKLLHRFFPNIFPAVEDNNSLPTKEPENKNDENDKKEAPIQNESKATTPKIKKSTSLVINHDLEEAAALIQNSVISSNEENDETLTTTISSPLSDLDTEKSRTNGQLNNNLLYSFALIFLGVTGSYIFRNSDTISAGISNLLTSSPEKSFARGIRRFRLFSYDDEAFDPHPEKACDYIAPYSMFSRIIGDACAWISGILYFTSRFPQVWLNYKRKSVQGLSFSMFFLSMCANVCYGLGIIIPGVTDWFVFFENVFPYLLGSLFTQFASGIIVIQFALYSWWPSLKGYIPKIKKSLKYAIDNRIISNSFKLVLGRPERYQTLPEIDEFSNANSSYGEGSANIEEIHPDHEDEETKPRNDEAHEVSIRIDKKVSKKKSKSGVLSTSLKKAKRNYAKIEEENEINDKKTIDSGVGSGVSGLALNSNSNSSSSSNLSAMNEKSNIPKNLSATDLRPYGTFEDLKQ